LLSPVVRVRVEVSAEHLVGERLARLVVAARVALRRARLLYQRLLR
jgi:hypothetical protein